MRPPDPNSFVQGGKNRDTQDFIIPGLGLGAFVELDYTQSQAPRNEHAVLLVSGDWNSLYDLLADPSVFVEAWRARYKGTPNTLRGPEWNFKDPITIVLEPLTTPCAANYALLGGLAPLFPGLLPPDFIFQLLHSKAGRPATQPLLDSVSPAVLGGANQVPNWGAKSVSTVEPSLGTAGFSLKYVAEFALYTRTLTIRYVPQAPETVQSFFQADPTLATDITMMSSNKVAHTDLHFLHFDINFPTTYHPRQISERRASFVMDWLVDPTFVNGVRRPTSDLECVAAFVHDNRQANLLTTKGVRTSGNHQLLNFTTPAAPSVIIDSVSIDLNMAPGKTKDKYDPISLQDEEEEGGGEPSPICVVANAIPQYQNGVLIGWLVGGVLIKSYSDLVGGG